MTSNRKQGITDLNANRLLSTAIQHHRQGLVDQAEALYRDVLALHDDVHALHGLGVLKAQSGHYEEAVELFSKAVRINPHDPSAHLNLGNALRALHRIEAALSSYAQALTLKPDYALALNNRGVCLLELHRAEESLPSFERALAIDSNYAEALNNRGNALFELRRYADALKSYDKAISLNAEYAEAFNNRGNLLMELEEPEKALASYSRAIAIWPDYADAFNNLGEALVWQRNYEQAASAFQKALQYEPDHEDARGNLLHTRMHCCDWATYSAEVERIVLGVRAGQRLISPFAFQAISHSPADLFTCSRTHANHNYPPVGPSLWKGQSYGHKRIRIGYVSGEFGEHATSYLITGLFELHDRERFECYGFDNGADDSSPMRRRIEKAFDAFFVIAKTSDRDVAQLIRSNEIDILVNLNGYFGSERTGVFAMQPSPVQVNYLGFPATMGAEYIDYILADRHLIHEDERKHYSEQVVFLPDSYQVNDAKRRISSHTPSRFEAGLPESDFVFCCFNNTYKFTPDIFDIWMRLLNEVDRSVLWLFESNRAAVENLRREAARRNIDVNRLVFASPAKLEDHLARQRLADLFLDTLPYNAHTTASDALWAGLPVLTCVGSTFPGRVGASLLSAVGLPELITHTAEEYMSLAVNLARDESLLASIKLKLAENRATHALFDTDKFRKGIESAYTTMWKQYVRGERPESFWVPT